MKVLDVASALESLAPTSLAADWDNVGLLVGDLDTDVSKLLLCIDATTEVLAEAVRVRADMVMAYHPVIFKSISRLTASEAPVVFEAVRQNIAIYSMHTALDSVVGGANDVLADVLGLQDRLPLEPIIRQGQCKIVVFVPPEDLPGVAHAAFTAGAGRIGNYYDCAFFCHGLGSFCGDKNTHPGIGAPGRHEVAEELRLEVVAPRSKAATVCSAIRGAHSYEEVALDVYPLEDVPDGCGLGRIGHLRRPAMLQTLLGRIKRATGVKKLQVAKGRNHNKGNSDERITMAACGAGSCGSLFRKAAAGGAELYLTGEMRHHDALAAAEIGMTVVCVGHSNSERLALAHLAGRLRKMTPELKVALSKKDRDPFEIV